MSTVAMLLSAMDLSDAPPDVITVLLGNMELKQRFTCALVCSDWAKAAAAVTHSIVRNGMRDLKGLQQWLEKNGRRIKIIKLLVCREAEMARLPCTQLQHLLLHGEDWDCRLAMESRVWTDIAAATKLTSVSLHWVCTDSQQADMVSALTALPDLQQLAWRAVQCGHEQELSDSRLLQCQTKLTALDLRAVSSEALQHLGSVSKLQHLNINGAPAWAAANCPGLQQLTALTSLRLGIVLRGLPSMVSHLTALQQLEVSAATSTELNGLKALTALTELRVAELKRDATPLQLTGVQRLDLSGRALHRTDLHMQLSSCTQLRWLNLYGFCLMGPDSLAASSMLQELCVQDCSLFSPEGPAGVDPWQLVFPGPGRLPHLTSLELKSAFPPPQQADLERLVECCSGLRLLRLLDSRLSWSLTSASAFECLSHLTNLVTLHLSTVTDQQCSSSAQLTGLQDLRLSHPQELSAVGLRHLAGLQQLTKLCLWGAFDASKVSAVLQAQLRGTSHGDCCVLVNKAPPGSPPDVSARLLRACDMAAEAAAAALAPQTSSALKP